MLGYVIYINKYLHIYLCQGPPACAAAGREVRPAGLPLLYGGRRQGSGKPP